MLGGDDWTEAARQIPGRDCYGRTDKHPGTAGATTVAEALPRVSFGSPWRGNAKRLRKFDARC
jgi:hypothetical protein